MMHSWTLLRSDDAVGAERALEVASICATLVDPQHTALRLESSQLATTGKITIAYHLHESCIVAGQHCTTASVKTWLLRAELPEGASPFSELAVRDADAAIQNAKAILRWMQLGERYHLATAEASQRTIYQPGAPIIQPITLGHAETPSLAKAAALGRFGIGLIEITGAPSAPRFALHRDSATSTLLDADGAPVTYDAADLIMGEINDALPLHHPYIVAYRAVLTWLDLRATLGRETHGLLVTPDLLDKRAVYDPSGKQAIIHPNASGRQWDELVYHFT